MKNKAKMDEKGSDFVLMYRKEHKYNEDDIRGIFVHPYDHIAISLIMLLIVLFLNFHFTFSHYTNKLKACGKKGFRANARK